MKTIYLVRHGLPDFPGGRYRCLGRTDLPLGPLGRMQSALAGYALERAAPVTVYVSPLLRARQTARWLPGPKVVLPGLEELDAGDWDGLTFDEIQARWPALYEARGRDPSLQPPNAEPLRDGRARFLAALRRAAACAPGDAAVAGHAGPTGLLLAALSGSPGPGPKVPCGSITTLRFEGGRFAAESVGVTPRPALDDALCRRLLSAAGTPEQVVRHCAAVAAEAGRLTAALSAAGTALDGEQVRAAAWLHDLARAEDDHAVRGAHYLRELGYEGTAALVERHHDADCAGRPDGAAVVYLADKLVLGDRPVSLAERFAASRDRCRTEAARRAFESRYDAAVRLARIINERCGGVVAAIS